ncbi:DUF6247 family protein [Amycolatopsis pithecellobii]|uniref:DUF6247 family protein n=1 Tax=Amycolatopsis pithecellobii TaxID=664692 RepID=UPI001FEAB93C|nr:DUF6247 family protein [Amycolatopsis pithecellobii]
MPAALVSQPHTPARRTPTQTDPATDRVRTYSSRPLAALDSCSALLAAKVHPLHSAAAPRFWGDHGELSAFKVSLLVPGQTPYPGVPAAFRLASKTLSLEALQATLASWRRIARMTQADPAGHRRMLEQAKRTLRTRELPEGAVDRLVAEGGGARCAQGLEGEGLLVEEEFHHVPPARYKRNCCWRGGPDLSAAETEKRWKTLPFHAVRRRSMRTPSGETRSPCTLTP